MRAAKSRPSNRVRSEPRHKRNKGRKWRRTRESFFDQDPENRLCRHCLERGVTAEAVVVDHVVPVVLDPSREFDLDNLQGLCAACDKIKTANDGSQRR